MKDYRSIYGCNIFFAKKLKTIRKGIIHMPKNNLSQKKPNILLIIMDCARANNFSCYGYDRKTTPNIDKIASEGILFEQCISVAPWSVPSHASLFTGKFPFQHQMNHSNPHFDGKFDTLAEILQSNGYQTAGFSSNAWIGHDTGLARGFDSFFETWKPISNPPISKLARIKKKIKGSKALYPVRLIKRKFFTNTSKSDKSAKHINTMVKNWLANSSKENPFFIFVNYSEAHLEYKAPEPFKTMFLPTQFQKRIKSVNQDNRAFFAGKIKMEDEDFYILRFLYDGAIAYLDYRVGGLVDYLKVNNLLDDTILIITSDHGENIGEHNLMDHQFCLYDTLLHIPLVIRFPKEFPPGLRITKQVQNIDILPTLLDIINVNSDMEMEGNNLLSDNFRDFTYAEYAKPVLVIENLRSKYPDVDFSKYNHELKMIRTDSMKLIYSPTKDCELYDIKNDSEELHDLTQNYPGKVEELKQMLFDWLEPKKNENAKKSEATLEFDEATKKHLRALGYI